MPAQWPVHVGCLGLALRVACQRRDCFAQGLPAIVIAGIGGDRRGRCFAISVFLARPSSGVAVVDVKNLKTFTISRSSDQPCKEM